MKGSRIVIWCGESPNQKALANKLSQLFPIAGIVIDRKKHIVNSSQAGIIWKITDRICFRKLYNSWTSMLKGYNKDFPVWPDVPVLKADTINSKAVKDFTENLKPDLIVVSGTSLVKKPVLDAQSKIGIINLHTGLSPYIKGGPNCTNWCIAENKWNQVGNTIMWINTGIDSGNIITTETIEIRDSRSLFEAHFRVMEHAHDLYIRAIQYLLSSDQPFTSIDQKSVAKGTLYLNKMWTWEKKKAVLKNWKKRELFHLENPEPITIPLPES